MITIKTAEEIEILREGGKRLAFILKTVSEMIAPGVLVGNLNKKAQEMALENGDKPAFLDYKPYGAKQAYPASLCVSVNDEIVHGISNKKEKVLREGDIVSLDMGLIHRGFVTDSAITVPVGKINKKAKLLIEVTRKALFIGIEAVKIGNTVGDIGYAIEHFVKPYEYGIVRDLAGHGVGYKVHEDPYIPNFGNKGEGEKLQIGMVIAIEPMLNEGTQEIILDSDGYTYRTADGKKSAHFEHTVALTKDGVKILSI